MSDALERDATDSRPDEAEGGRGAANPADSAPKSGPPRGLRLAAGLALVVSAAFYLPSLGKGFVSEDWLLIPLHRAAPPWNDLISTFTGPWLGMRVFQFYRPVAAIAFAAEAKLFGAWSPGYNLTHLLVHLLTTALVMALTWRLLRACLPGRSEATLRGAALATGVAGLFFGLHPLAPNAVLFAASFATVFGGLATVASAVLYVGWRESGNGEPSLRSRPPLLRPALLAGSVVLYAVALGCYESSVALPAWLFVYELPSLWSRSRRHSALAALAPFVLLAVGYFALRRTLFDQVLGGYPDIAAQLRHADFSAVTSALSGLARLPSPWFSPTLPGRGWESGGLLLAVAAIASWSALAPSGRRAGLLRLFGLGLAWALVFQAPFLFWQVDPAGGRFWYQAAAGAAVALSAVLALALSAERARAGARALVGVGLLLLLGRNALLLRDHLGWMREAASTCARIADEIERVAGEHGEPLFVADHPLFLQSSEGVNLAQLYLYGLRAAVRPPFRSPGVDVFPMPGRDRADASRMAAILPVYRWRADQGRLERWRPTELPPLLEIEAPPPREAIVPEDSSSLEVRVAAAHGTRARVLVVAPGNFTAQRVGVGEGGLLRLPGEALRLWQHLTPGPQFWWVETLDGAGKVTAESEPREIEVLPSPE